MEVRYSIVLHPHVTTKDIPALDAFWRQEIRDAVRAKLRTQPDLYGKPLRHSLKGIRALRVGDYRVLYEIRNVIVFVGAIKHRSFEYEAEIGSRFKTR